jgi:hypothetical protein
MDSLVKHIHSNHNLYASILVGIATIATAFATFTGGLWNSTSTSNYSKSIIDLNEANTTYIEYAQGGIEESELEKIMKEYEADWHSAQEKMQLADEANEHSDKFQLATVLFSIAIFFSSISLIVLDARVKLYFFCMGLLLTTVATGWMLSLPRPF